MGFQFDSPLKPIKPFPDATDSSTGIYGDNPTIPLEQDGPDKHKFFETIPTARTHELDSPMSKATGKLGDHAPYAPSGGDAAHGSGNWDTPLKPLKKI